MEKGTLVTTCGMTSSATMPLDALQGLGCRQLVFMGNTGRVMLSYTFVRSSKIFKSRVIELALPAQPVLHAELTMPIRIKWGNTKGNDCNPP